MTKCYIPGCENDATSSSGLCDECLLKSLQDHVRAHAGEIPADCVEHWDHRPDQVWYWSTDGLWKLADGDPRVLPDFGGFERPEPPRPNRPSDELSNDLVAIISAQAAEIKQLKADKMLLEQIVAQERAATGRSFFYPN